MPRMMPEGMSARETDPWETLYEARDKGRVVQGTIVRTRHIDGQGATWEVSFGEKEDAFGIRGLVPEGESGLPDGLTMNELRNQIVTVKVKGIDRKNKIVALSRKEVVQENLTNLVQGLAEGESLMAMVRATIPAGVVVDVGGGVLVRMTNDAAKLSRGVPVEAQYHVGQLVDVDVTSIDKPNRQIRVEARNPWKAGEYGRGEMVAGRIVQINDNIAFVQVKPGLVGIAPYPRSESAKVGEYLDYQVTSYNAEKMVLHLIRWDKEKIRERRRRREQQNRRDNIRSNGKGGQ